MEITSAKWATDKSIKIGATPKQVMAKYGKTKYEDAYQRPIEQKVFTGEKWLVYIMKKMVRVERPFTLRMVGL